MSFDITEQLRRKDAEVERLQKERDALRRALQSQNHTQKGAAGVDVSQMTAEQKLEYARRGQPVRWRREKGRPA